MFRGFREIREVKPEEKNLALKQACGNCNRTVDELNQMVGEIFNAEAKAATMTVDEAQAFWDDFWNDMDKKH
jgi:hypothetical protein